MFRHLSIPLMIPAFLACLVSCSAQAPPATLCSLPADGNWVEYAWKLTRPGKQIQTGTLRISSVGEQQLREERYRWVEFKLQHVEGDVTHRHFRKLLFPVQAFEQGRLSARDVPQAYDQQKADGPIGRLSPGQINDFLALGFKAENRAPELVKEKEEVTTPLGRYVTRHVTVSGQRGNVTVLYHGWLSKDVPFGGVRFEIHERPKEARPVIVFTASTTKSGSGARSDLDENQAK